MSRMPARYLHVPRAYYYSEDTAEYSESEVEYPYADPRQEVHPGWGQVHEMVPGRQDVTELYRRKHEDRYMVQQDVVLPEESPRYYYRPAPIARLPQHRLPVPNGTHALQPQPVSAPIPQQRAYYTQDEDNGVPTSNMYESYMYQQPPQPKLVHQTLGNTVRRGPPAQVITEQTPQVTKVVRAVRTSKPVSVRTPRYYRPQPGNLYKKPSTLCIPLATQPDPGAIRPTRSRHSSAIHGLVMKQQTIQPHQQRQQQQQQQQHMQTNNQYLPDHTRHVPDSPKSAPATCSIQPNTSIDQQDRLQQIQTLILERRNEQDDQIQDRGDDIRNCEDEISNVGDDFEKSPNFELMLSDYQQMFHEDMRSPKTKSKLSVRSRTKHKRSAQRIPPTQLLQPRLPPSLKAKKKSKASLKSSQIMHESENAEDNRIEIEQMTTEVLDSLLQDLSENGLVNSDQNEPTHEENNKSSMSSARSALHIAQQNKKEQSTNDTNTRPPRKQSSKQFVSVHEIRRSTEPPRIFDETPTKTTFMQDKAKFCQYEADSSTSFRQSKLIGQSEMSFHRDMKRTTYGNDDKFKLSNLKLDLNLPGRNATKKSPWTSTNFEPANEEKQQLDESSANELHRSKSYIVNLIDRALSRELGTIPEEKPPKQYMNLDARAALDLMSSPAAKNLDNDLCMEITHALAETLTANISNQQNGGLNQPSSSGTNVAPEGSRSEHKKDDELIYSTGVEEPIYIRQLKKLRWGHLKHIQREMRRLEDLERFLDSCGADK